MSRWPDLTERIEFLEKHGWKFLPYAPNEWMWMLFDAAGKRIAVQGDHIWNAYLVQYDREKAA